MAGLSSREVAEELGASRASALGWARAVASLPGSVPPRGSRGRKLVAVDEAS